MFSYSGPLFDDGVLLATVTAGLESQLFIELCVSLCEKLKGLLGLSEAITPPQGKLLLLCIMHNINDGSCHMTGIHQVIQL